MAVPTDPGPQPVEGIDQLKYLRELQEWKRAKENFLQYQADQEATRATNKQAASQIDERQLSLQEGYTALDKSLANPPFDPRITALTLGQVSQQLQRGQMIQNSFYARTAGQIAPYRLNFLYNPSSVSVNYAALGGQWDPSQLTTDASKVSLAFMGMQTMAFDLLFDRTYEVAYLDRPHKDLESWGNALSAGVYADIRALERLVGIRNGTGPIQPVPIDVYFGALLGKGDKTKTYTNKRGQVVTEILGPNNNRRPLGFFGIVTSLAVTYTHFSHTMTPMRATVNLSMSQVNRDANRPGGVGEFVSEEEAGKIEETG